MILDLQRFLREERPHWERLEAFLARLEADAGARLSVAEAQEFHRLYERAAADLAKVATFAAEPGLRRHLENLVARAHSEIHETRGRLPLRGAGRWFAETLPRTFRARIAAFWLACAVMAGGALFGGLAVVADPQAKAALLPEWSHVRMDPEKRVQREESGMRERGGGAGFAAELIQNNVRVTIFAAALGFTWGVGTLVMLLYNGIIVGAVAADYILAGKTAFLLGWLLPHGSVEIPACLIGGQVGFLVARALLGRGSRLPMRARLRAVTPDAVTLLGGAALLLLWAGVVESFFSQIHEPVLPYAAKIGFGATTLLLLGLYLGLAGRRRGGAAEGAAR